LPGGREERKGGKSVFRRLLGWGEKKRRGMRVIASENSASLFTAFGCPKRDKKGKSQLAIRPEKREDVYKLTYLFICGGKANYGLFT